MNMKRFENNELFKKLFVGWIVPANRSLGIRLKSVDGKKIVMRLKKCRKNTNYGGTVHGAAMMALGETIHGMAVLDRFGTFDHLIVSKDVKLKFTKKAKGELQVAYNLPDEIEALIARKLEDNHKCEVDLMATITDKDSATVAEMTATYHIRRVKK